MKYFKGIVITIAVFVLNIASIANAEQNNADCTSMRLTDAAKATINSVDNAFLESFFPQADHQRLLSPVCHIAPREGIEYTTSRTVEVTSEYRATDFRPRFHVWDSDAATWKSVPTEMNRMTLTAKASVPIDAIVAVMADERIVYEGIGSWYAHKRYPDGAATNIFPIGTRLKVTNTQNSKSTTVRVTSTWTQKNPKRVIDLVKTAFQKIANPRTGLIRVRIEKL